MNTLTECHPDNRCVTCPVALLKLQDQLRASGLIEAVMASGSLSSASSPEDVVTNVKAEADIQEVDQLAGIAVGAVAYRLSGRCPQVVRDGERRTVLIKEL
ncbi:MAG TPA: hypothetical protein VFH39_03600 [Candidatus Saccharimonadales bacterium]|nr:hypothetical protein [Candidatus Saccharimonadales bacterium]